MAGFRKLRIAFIDYILDPTKPGRSGLSDIVWDMAVELVNQGHEAHIIGSYLTTQYPDSRVIVHNFPAPPIGYRNVLGHFWLLKRAADIARRIQPDVIHAPEYLSTAVFAALGVKVPLVLTVPGNVFHRVRYGHSYEWHYLQVLKWAARTSAKRCAAIIAVSEEMKRWWQWTGSAPEKTHWIPYGVSTERFHPHSDARNRLGISDDQLLLLYVGRFASEKGLLDLLNAASQLHAKIDGRNVKIMLVGKGPQEEEIQYKIRSEGLEALVQVRSWVSQEELPLFYSAADALLLPSHTEAFARVIPEALSCGTPVIGSKITGTEDHIRPGETGFLFAPGDVQALEEILYQVIQNPKMVRDLKPTSYQYIQSHLSWQQIVDRIVREVYNPLSGAETAFEGQLQSQVIG